MKKTTVVIPNYNGMKYIGNCMLALQRQTAQEFHIILVDNGSSDGSPELVMELYPHVKILRFETNQGFCAAVNAGILAASTPYVILLNNDTEVDSRFVESLEGSIEKSDRIFSVSSKMLSMQEPERIDDAGDFYCAFGWAYGMGRGRPKSCCDRERSVFSACGGASIYRKQVFRRIGMFDENHFAYLEDVDIGYRAQIYGYENRYTPTAEVLHAGSGFSGSRYNEFKIKLSSRNSVYLVYKNMPFFQIILNAPFLAAGFLIKFLFFCAKGMGGVYLRGIGKGIAMCMGEEGRQHKVPFRFRYMGNYCRIQAQLWLNILRKLSLKKF